MTTHVVGTVVSAFTLLLFVSSASGQELKTYKSDESDGMAIWLTAPESWAVTLSPPGVRMIAPGNVDTSKASLTVEFYRMPNEPAPWNDTSPESFAARLESGMEQFGATALLEAGTSMIDGGESHYAAYTTQCDAAEGGGLLQYLVKDGFNIHIRYGSCDAEAFAAHRADAEKIIASIRFGPWEPNFSEEGEPWEIFDSPMLQMSDGGRYYQYAGIFAEVPPGWIAVPFGLAMADGPDDPGYLVVDFESVSADVILRVHVQGLPLRPHNREEYLATAETLFIDKFLVSYDKTEPEPIHLPRLATIGLSQFLHWRGPGGLYYRVYSGMSDDGRDINIETYTSGGFTVVYHVFVVGSEDQLQRLRDDIDGLLGTIVVRAEYSLSPIP